jgi:hypothetical protein
MKHQQKRVKKQKKRKGFGFLEAPKEEKETVADEEKREEPVTPSKAAAFWAAFKKQPPQEDASTEGAEKKEETPLEPLDAGSAHSTGNKAKRQNFLNAFLNPPQPSPRKEDSKPEENKIDDMTPVVESN